MTFTRISVNFSTQLSGEFYMMENIKSKGRANAIDIIIGQQLRTKRLEKNLSQEELGDAMGVTFQQIQKYENGANRLSASRLFIAAYALDSDLTEFFKNSEGEHFFDIIKSDDKKNEFAEIMLLFENIKDIYSKKKILKFID